MSIWDDPELQIGGDYVRFDNPGDSVTGTITAVRKHTFPDGKSCVELVLDTDDGVKTLTAGQIVLARKLAELRPTEGDKIGVRFDKTESRPGGKTLKHFTVQVQNGAAPAADPAPADEPASEPAEDSPLF